MFPGQCRNILIQEIFLAVTLRVNDMNIFVPDI